jgi:dTDP-4-amino-4,6-dideoxygalactose transaminase
VIPLLDLVAQYRSIQPEIDAAVLDVLASGKFILGPNVSALEEEIASYLGVRYAVGVASGTDALIIALRAAGLDLGDEVIVPAYSFFASAGAVLSVGARPVFVDINSQDYCLDNTRIEKVITPRTRAILPVHLYGQPAEMDALLALAHKHHLLVIEDVAQALGAEYHGRKAGSFGDIGCLSFFPSKNLGGYGDGGMLVTNDEGLAEKARMLRTHGWKKKYFPEVLGYNSRLDEIQAAVLRVKLRYLDRWNDRRWQLAQEYNRRLQEIGLSGPQEAAGRKHVYHLYMVHFEQRDRVQQSLKSAGIASEVYYPQPLHLASPCRALGYREGQFPVSEAVSRHLLALPLFSELTGEQVDEIFNMLKKIICAGDSTQ